MAEETIGEKIYRQRKVKGLSQDDLAEAIGVSRQAISKWETNSMQPTLENVKLLCTALDVNIEYFIDDDAKQERDAEAAISLENVDTLITEIRRNKRTGLIIGIVIVSLLFVISLIITIVVGMAFFPTTTGDYPAVISSGISERTFAIVLIITIILFVADIAFICILLLNNKRKSKKS